MICPICNNEIPDKSKFCGKCGNEIPRCPTCGRVLSNRVKYCVSDGTEIPQHVLALIPASEIVKQEGIQKKFCIKCGKPCQEGEKYCPECKARMNSINEDSSRRKIQASVHSQAKNQSAKVEQKKRGIFPLVIFMLLLLLITALLLFFFFGRGSFGNVNNEAENSVSTSNNVAEEEAVQGDRDFSTDSADIEVRENQNSEDSIVSDKDSNTEEMEESSTGVLVELAPPKGAYTEVALSSASATSVLEPESEEYHYEPYRAIDNDTITSWQEGAKGDGIGERLTIYMTKKSNVKYICLWGGNWRADEQFRNNNRPKDVKINIGDREFNIKLPDGKKEKYIVFQDPIETSQIVFTFESVYKGVTSEDLCISEVKIYA